MEIGGEVQTKRTPCAVQRNRASREVTDKRIISDYERYSSYAGIALIVLFAFIFLAEVWPW